MEKERVAITGGNGFVGRYLVEELEREWPESRVEVWDLPDVDITKPETYQNRLVESQPTWLVHLAAVASVPASLRDPALTHRVNVEATQNILEAGKEMSPKTKFFVASSSDIYGQGASSPLPDRQAGLPELPLSEAKPKSPYAKSKWEMEKIIEEKFKDQVLRVRPFPHVGPGQALGFVTADFASQIAAIEKGEQESVMKVGSLEAKRDFTDVRDVVRAYRLLMEKGKLGEVYHVAAGTAISIQDVLDRLLAMSDAEIVVEQDPERMRPSDIPVLVGDASKLREATGWEPTIPLEQTLEDILDWWRANGTASR